MGNSKPKKQITINATTRTLARTIEGWKKARAVLRKAGIETVIRLR